LINALHLRYRRPDDPAGDVQPKLGHRLDKETSGVLVVCKSDAARQSVSRQFERGLVRKEYLALVEGRPVPAKGTVDAPLGRALGARVALAQAVRPDGLPALTRYEELDHGAAFALVRAMPETGRQHQVRVHLAHVGCPILCDKLYGRRSALRLAEVRPLRPGEEDGLLLSRHALHAHRITLAHPATGEPLTLEAPLPEDMASVIRAWGGRWPLADHAT
jgi:23S rRNA pseudouridine1911/1915/1917 synthase